MYIFKLGLFIICLLSHDRHLCYAVIQSDDFVVSFDVYSHVKFHNSKLLSFLIIYLFFFYIYFWYHFDFFFYWDTASLKVIIKTYLLEKIY